MPAFCVVVGCSTRAERDLNSFFRIPAIPTRGSPEIVKLKTERRQKWIAALKRSDLTEANMKHKRICDKHFITGRPANLSDAQHPDWVPRVLMGNKKKLDATSTINRYHRAKFRSEARNAQAGSTFEDIKLDGSFEVEDNANEADISTTIEVPSSSQSNSSRVPTDYIALGSVLKSIPLSSNQMGLDIEPDGSFEVEYNANEADISTTIKVPSSSQSRQSNSFRVPTDYTELGSVLETIPSDQMGLDIERDGSFEVEDNANEAEISTNIEVPSSSQSRQRNSFRVPTDYMELASVLESIPLPSGWCKISKPDDKLYLFASYGCLNFSEEKDIKNLLHALSTPAKMVVVDIKRLSFSCHVYVNTKFLKSVETYLVSEVADLLVSTENTLPCTGVGTLKEFNFEYSDKNCDDSNRILYSNNCQGSVWSSSRIQSCDNCQSARERLVKTIVPR